jgi:hypothetical protein
LLFKGDLFCCSCCSCAYSGGPYFTGADGRVYRVLVLIAAVAD